MYFRLEKFLSTRNNLSSIFRFNVTICEKNTKVEKVKMNDNNLWGREFDLYYENICKLNVLRCAYIPTPAPFK